MTRRNPRFAWPASSAGAADLLHDLDGVATVDTEQQEQTIVNKILQAGKTFDTNWDKQQARSVAIKDFNTFRTTAHTVSTAAKFFTPPVPGPAGGAGADQSLQETSVGLVGVLALGFVAMVIVSIVATLRTPKSPHYRGGVHYRGGGRKLKMSPLPDARRLAAMTNLQRLDHSKKNRSLQKLDPAEEELFFKC
jgi:hypothetical protein